MSKLTQLESSIREALPELQEVARGCRFKDLKIKSEEYIIDSIENNLFSFSSGINSYKQDLTFLATEDAEILGHEIRLHHVLKWYEYLNHYKGEFDQFTSGFGFRDYQLPEVRIFYWDLSKPFKDQKEATINYLHSLSK